MFKVKGLTPVFNPRFIFFIIIPILICLPFFSVGVDMFGWFKREEVLLSSPVQGQLLDGDKPLSGITVTRELTYGKEYTDTAVTDSNGNFSFPNKMIKSNKPNQMFDNDSIDHNIFISHKNKSLILWTVRLSHNPANDTGLVRNLNNLICNINIPAKIYFLPIEKEKTRSFSIYSMCNIK